MKDCDKKILIIDDDSDHLLLLKTLFERHQFEVAICTSAQDALQVLPEQSFDLVICDFMMPKMDGMEFIRQLRSESELPVIILTASRDDKKEELCSLGATGFFMKHDPFDLLLEKVQEILD